MSYQFDLLIFDLDGTLIDSQKDIAISVNYTLSYYNAPHLENEFLYTAIATGVYKLLVESLSSFSIPSEEIINTFRGHYLSHLLDNTTCFPYVYQVLDKFRDKKKAIITNKPDEYTLPVINGLDLIDHFDIIKSGNSNCRPKPHPESIEQVIKAIGSLSVNTLIIGDNNVDIEVGIKAGIKTCWAAYGYGKLDSLTPDFQINSFLELLGLVGYSPNG
ncbi:MAG: HAD-IA family hydrolase [bacterium]